MNHLFSFIFRLALVASLIGVTSAAGHQLSTHILDIGSGEPAPGVRVTLYKHDADSDAWTKLAEVRTDEAGRIGTFLERSNHAGTYKLVFRTAEYFDKRGQESFYPFIPVVFTLKPGSHYHVPITLSRFGYSTYRGS